MDVESANEFTTGEEKFAEREREKRVYKSFSGYGEEESTWVFKQTLIIRCDLIAPDKSSGATSRT